MSTKPNPVALTAAMLALRYVLKSKEQMTWRGIEPISRNMAVLASDLHRLAKGCQRHAVAVCNGEWRDGQRDYFRRAMRYDDGESREEHRRHANQAREGLEELDRSIEAYGVRLDRRIAKLNAQLALLGLRADRHGNPRGIVLRLTATDGSAPVPRNGMSDDSWGIA